MDTTESLPDWLACPLLIILLAAGLVKSDV
jgi:hypothetical protein